MSSAVFVQILGPILLAVPETAEDGPAAADSVIAEAAETGYVAKDQGGTSRRRFQTSRRDFDEWPWGP